MFNNSCSIYYDALYTFWITENGAESEEIAFKHRGGAQKFTNSYFSRCAE